MYVPICPHICPQFILFCVECGMVNCVKWYIERGQDLNISDSETDNIAIYAYKFKISEDKLNVIAQYLSDNTVLRNREEGD